MWGYTQRHHVNQIGSLILASSCFDFVCWANMSHWGCPHWIPMIGRECVRALGGSDVVYVLMPWDIGINTQTLDVSLALLTSQTCQISCACRIPWMYTRPRHEWGDIMKRAVVHSVTFWTYSIASLLRWKGGKCWCSGMILILVFDGLRQFSSSTWPDN